MDTLQLIRLRAEFASLLQRFDIPIETALKMMSLIESLEPEQAEIELEELAKAA